MKESKVQRRREDAPVDTQAAASSFETMLALEAVHSDTDLARILDTDMARIFSVNQNDGMLQTAPRPVSRTDVWELLNQCLANCVDLHNQCKQAQWNVTDTVALAPCFAQTAEAVENYADRLAACLASLGGVPAGAFDTVAERSGLNAYPSTRLRDHQHADAVASALAVMSVSLRADLVTMGRGCDRQTSALLQALSRSIDWHLDRVTTHTQPVAAG